MGERLNRLTATEVKSAIADGRGAYDGGGLLIPPGRQTWAFRYTSPVKKGERRDAGLGPLSLAAARKEAERLRRMVRDGRDPLIERERAAELEREEGARRKRTAARQANTLEFCATAYHDTIKAGFRNEKHREQWLASLKLHVFPLLGAKPIADVTADDLLAVMLPLRDKVPETARRVRMRLAAVFDDAVLRGVADRNPAAAIKRRVRDGSARKLERHHAALPYADVPAFVVELRKFENASVASRLALEFAILTAARTGEVLGARWAEIDRRAKVWTVPGERMKGGRAHRVPLSERTLEILDQAKPLGGAEFVFPSPTYRKRGLSGMALLMLLRRIKTGSKREDGEPETFADLTTAHGLCRSTFSTWAREKTRYRPDVIEAALAHREEDRVARAYSRAEYWRERTELAAAWAQFVTKPAQGKVIRAQFGGRG